MLGMAILQLRKFDAAIEQFALASRLKPDLALAHHGRGLVLLAQEKLDQAIEATREAIRLKPTYAEAHCALGSALAKQQEQDDRIAAFRESGVFTLSSIIVLRSFSSSQRLDETRRGHRPVSPSHPA